VPSSTSSSEGGPAARTRATVWLGALLLAGGMLAAYEVALRARGIRPSVTDDPELWTVVRGEASPAGPATLAILGSSRIQGAFDPAAAREVVPEMRCVQLAIDATHAVAALRDLADDPSFRGTALMSLLPGELRRKLWDSQAAWVDRRDAGFTWNDAANRRLRAALQERFAVLAPEAELRLVIGGLWARGAGPWQGTSMSADRTRRPHYGHRSPEQLARSRLARDREGFAELLLPVDENAWRADVDAFDAIVRRIVARGGRVILFHDHLTGAYRATFEAPYPRARFWDVLAARSSAVCLHADDVPEIAALPCPDGSHVDAKDAPAFTRALIGALKRRGVF
jgi:hypothetical protein